MSKRRRSASRPPSTPTQRPKPRDVFVARPFEGLADEREWIALRELVPAATAPLRLRDEVVERFGVVERFEVVERFGERQVLLATVLPMAWPAMTRPSGQVLVGLQRAAHSGDPSRDIAAALLSALRTEPGQPVAVPALPGPGPRLQDLLAAHPLEVTLHDSFEFWLADGAADDPGIAASLERANASVFPTVKLTAAPAAYWCRVPDRAHVRWVLAEEEDVALDALARLGAAGHLPLGAGTRFAGMFRAHGRLVPVWDLPREPDAATWEAPLAEFTERYERSLASREPVTAAERRARQGLVGRQLTLR